MSAGSETDAFMAALHRTVLGVLLAMAGMIGLAWFIGAMASASRITLLFGIGGLLIAIVAGYWILLLFLEGFRER